MVKQRLFKFLRKYVLQKYVLRQVKAEQNYEALTVLKNIPSQFLAKLSREEILEVKDLWNLSGGVKYNLNELGLFKYFNNFDPRYLCHSIYLPIIAHKLNNYHYTKLFEHKSLLGYLVKGRLKYPTCFVRSIDGEYYDGAMLQISKDDAIKRCMHESCIVIKDSVDSSGGKGVELLKLGNYDESSRLEKLRLKLSERKSDFVIQECIRQHESFAKFNSSSINTLRVTTLYLNGKFSVLSIVLRFGKSGMTVDNWGSGGIIVGVGKDGRLHKKGYDIQLHEYNEYNDIVFEKECLSQVPLLLAEIEDVHKHCFSLCKFIGWDICFNEENVPIIIELNSSQPGVIGEQLCTGPIFGDRTKEVVEYCSQKDFVYHKSILNY